MFLRQIQVYKRLHVIAYPAMLDVPRELVRHLARLLAGQRRAIGTRRGTRALTCFYQALLVLIWFRKAEDTTLLSAGFGVSRATAYRYVAEGVAVLAACRPDLHEALRRAAADLTAVSRSIVAVSDDAGVGVSEMDEAPLRPGLSTDLVQSELRRAGVCHLCHRSGIYGAGGQRLVHAFVSRTAGVAAGCR